MRGKRWILLAALLVFAGLALPKAALAGDAGGLVGTDTCATCHEEQAKAFKATPHAQSALGCEGCHGPGQAHVDGSGDKTKIKRFGELTPAESSAICLSCHTKGNQALWTGSTHDGRRLACVTCHEPHPKGAVPASLLRKPQTDLCGGCHAQQKAKLYRNAHMPVREGKMQCTSCHNPHGTVNPSLLIQHSVNENCYSCHAEKRGPFLWEHAPARDNCLNCHEPHGSNNDKSLAGKKPFLCQRCHVATRHPATLYDNPDLTRKALLKAPWWPVSPPKKPLRKPEDLADHVLLHSSASNDDDWRLWLTAAGLPYDLSKQPGVTFDLIFMTIQAAIDGLGVAMGRTSYVQDDIQKGRLVVPFEIELPVDAGFYLVSPEAKADSPKVSAFRKWLSDIVKAKPEPLAGPLAEATMPMRRRQL